MGGRDWSPPRYRDVVVRLGRLVVVSYHGVVNGGGIVVVCDCRLISLPVELGRIVDILPCGFQCWGCC